MSGQYEFQSYANLFNDALAAQHAQKQKELLDSLTNQDLKSQIHSREMRDEADAETKKANAELHKEQMKAVKQKNATIGMVAGMPVTPEKEHELTDVGLGHMIKPGAPGGMATLGATPTAVEGSAPAPEAPAMIAAMPQDMPVAEPVPTLETQQPDKPTTFAGTAEDQAMAALLKSLPPDSPEAHALQYESATGKSAPAGMFDHASHTPMTPEMGAVVKDASGKVLQGVVSVQGGVGMLNGQPLPPGAHVERAAPPVDASAAALRDANLTNARSKRQDDSYARNTTLIDKLAAPLDAADQRLARISDTLAQGNPQADALIAPELMIVMAGGQGSGLRVNSAEIARVAGGATQAIKLEQFLNKWSLNPNQEIIPPEMRKQIRDLVGVVQDKISRKQDAITAARNVLADPDSTVEQHRKAVNTLHSDLTMVDRPDHAASTKADDLIKKYGGGK